VAKPAEEQAQAKKPNNGIRAARVRRDIDSNLLNKQLLDHLSEHRQVVDRRKYLEAALKSGKVTENKVERDLTPEERAKFNAELVGSKEVWQRAVTEIEMYKSHRTRFSATTSAALTALANHVLRTLLCFGARRLSEKENTLYLHHIAHFSAEELNIYAILRNLSVFTDEAQAQHVKQMKEEHAAELKRLERDVIKKFKKDNNITIPRKKKVAVDAAVAAPAAVAETPAEVEVAKKPTHPFKVYVTQTWKSHPANTKKIKLSTAVKDFLANLVAQLIELISKLAEHQMASKNTKTINCDAVTDAVTTLYITYGAERQEVFTQSQGKVIPFEVLAAEKEKKRADPNYVIDREKLAKVDGTVVERSVNYVSPGLDELRGTIDAAVKQLLSQKETKEKERVAPAF
jgi:hypothetical protein